MLSRARRWGGSLSGMVVAYRSGVMVRRRRRPCLLMVAAVVVAGTAVVVLGGGHMGGGFGRRRFRRRRIWPRRIWRRIWPRGFGGGFGRGGVGFNRGFGGSLALADSDGAADGDGPTTAWATADLAIRITAWARLRAWRVGVRPGRLWLGRLWLGRLRRLWRLWIWFALWLWLSAMGIRATGTAWRR